jgi:hypothetical protein
MKMTLEALENDDFHKVAEIALVYYDKYYGYSLANRAKETISTIEMEPDKLMEAVDLLIEKGN